MIEEILEKIQKARTEYTDETVQQTLDDWENAVKDAGITLSAVNLEVIQKLLTQLATKVQAHRKRLSADSELGELERQVLFAEIKVYNEVLNYFLTAKNYIEYIKNEVNQL